MAVIALTMGILLAAGFYLHMRQVLESEVKDKANLIFYQVDAVQNYVRHFLRPRMYSELHDKFVIEAMSSSYVSRKVMDGIRQHTGNHIYRRVAINSRNKNFEATAEETKLINYFREHPDSNLWQGLRKEDGKEYFIMARPVKYVKSCMHCHGLRQDAPLELVTKYGDRGFKHKENSIDGLDYVGLPLSSAVSSLRGTVLYYLMIFSGSALLFFGLSNLFFKKVIADNLRALTNSFHRNIADDRGLELLHEVEHGDEVHEMIEGMEKLGKHLYENKAKLQEYATNLESMVEKRTVELSHETDERQADVKLFVKLLASLNCSHTRAELWKQALPLVVERFNLKSATFFCTYVSNNSYSWPENTPRPSLHEEWIGLLTEENKLILEGREAWIPVEPSAGMPEGILFLKHKVGNRFRKKESEILRALGRQLGIAVENINALDNALRHNANLQAIFEGITDPLLLVDVSGSPIMVNAAARDLSKILSNGKNEDGNILPYLKPEYGSDCDLTSAVQNEHFKSCAARTKDGRCFTLNLYPIQNSQDNNARIVTYIRETTSERQMLEQVSRAEKMATVGKLASGLAHEINNPLGVILCYAELLRTEMHDEGKIEDINVIMRHTRQAQKVLKDLLNFARPKIYTDKITDISEIASQVVEVFKVQAEKRKAVIKSLCEKNLPKVSVEPQAVENILANLLLNALDALSGPVGIIEVNVSSSADRKNVILTVSDNGTGISEEDLPRVFEPFYTTKGVQQGTGLGLAVVYGYMNDLGGSIEVTNRKDIQGTIFTLTFPATSSAAKDYTNKRES